MGKIYISQLFPEDKVSEILKDYDIGIEIIEFGIGYTLDKDDNGISEYCEKMGDLIKNKSLSIHGPFLDLNTASFDNMIKKATLTRYNQAYFVAKKLGADRIVFHSCYYEDIYFKDVYINNSLDFWREFLSDKDESIKIHIENIYEKDLLVLKELVDKVNSNIFSICLDIGHANCYSNESLEEIIKSLNNRIGHLHLSNNDGKRDSHCGFNNGNVDILMTLDLIDKYCNDPSMTIEVNNFNEAVESLSIMMNRNSK
ncbi:sugar phosphate isomerase/epimerase [Clostridium celatum]|uniref:AP endonuclease, family 2 n=1 Tax=Clostridium celatum DSM 1785 TaxID=545697 RepID=L1QET8_9CLOT|nr:TIM barrel protein [Clostridium celatum]EKY26451.1 AP endonuclease, family 2 [Clostridium celatum DSM 1785]MCE9654971.1 sugar phosphate isomerase/epimerase [Clostridium celatum]MDU2265994.1 TIM barrel protein [Clostridium celatum]MDU3722512.1 TIM barrel protein [Clostridium celatum]MDU6296314.1 TIM barrel protein [Clostridium celatum]